MSDIMLANIEALASDTEIGPAPGERYSCVYGIQYGGVGFVRNCLTCSWAYFVGSYSGLSHCYLHN